MSTNTVSATSAAAKRKPLSKKTRFEVFKRDGFRCHYCGAHPPGVLLHVDHIVAVAAGGSNAIDNLVTACEPCNLGKGARALAAVPRAVADKLKEAAELESQLLAYQDLLQEKRERLEGEAWEVAEVWMSSHAKTSIRKDWLLTIKSFIERLGAYACLDAMERAVGNCRGQDASFRYFCGICWSRIRENQK